MASFFKNIWNKTKGAINSITVSDIVSGVVVDIVVAAIGITVLGLFRGNALKGVEISKEAKDKVNAWCDNYFIPFFTNSIAWLNNSNLPVNSTDFIAKYNQVLFQFRSWQSYYEASALKTAGTEKEIDFAKSQLLHQAVQVFIQAFSEISNTAPTVYFLEKVSFDPTVIKEVGGDYFDWKSLKSIKANNLLLTDGDTIPTTDTMQYARIEQQQEESLNASFKHKLI